jgi:hypothetical protein
MNGRHSQTLEADLEQMLEIEKFDPPAEFRASALWPDPAPIKSLRSSSDGGGRRNT